MIFSETDEMLFKLLPYEKYFMKHRDVKDFPFDKYDTSISFTFAERESNFIIPKEPCNDVKQWCNYLKEYGIKRIFLFFNYEDNTSMMKKYTNHEFSSIITYFEDGTVSRWDIDKDVIFGMPPQLNYFLKETILNNNPDDYPVFEDPTVELTKALYELKELATKIECTHYAKAFNEAYCFITGSMEPTISQEWLDMLSLELEGHELNLYSALERAEVGGHMCSWNDMPPAEANSRGLLDEFNRITNNVRNLRIKALLYVLNK